MELIIVTTDGFVQTLTVPGGWMNPTSSSRATDMSKLTSHRYWLS